MAKKKRRRKKTTSEKVMLVLGVIIALSMILALIAGLGSGHRTGRTPLPDNWIEYDDGSWTEVDTSEIPHISSGPDMGLPAPAD
ncbi:MAG: hypothetical protein BMS9Abin02_1523 [Anaerolineae bacterium]|nr:MAG: hypothetical protein BMS9Abin02_1523 [Anaerolineae bacterium]